MSMATNEEIVARAQQLYVSYYGRPADPAGLDFWVQRLTEAGDNADQVLADFGASAEYTALTAGQTNRQVVNNLYQQMFNRDADEAGLTFYLERLESGTSSLASIALDIANGVEGTDADALGNKVEVANTFTAALRARDDNPLYGERQLDGARELLADVDGSTASRTAGNTAAASFVEDLPATREGGEFTLNDEDNATADFAGASSAVTVTLDDDEADFDVRLSSFDDTVVVEELNSAAIRDVGGVDTLDLSEFNGGAATVSLLAGTFRLADGAQRFGGTVSGIENVVGTDEDDTITGDNADNWITGGEGDDTLKGGLGDDYFVFEDEEEVGTGTVDGQTGTDTAVFTSDEIDLTEISRTSFAVENLMLTNAEGEDSVTLTLADSGEAATKLSVNSFDRIVGSSAEDTIVVDGDVDLSKVSLENVEKVLVKGEDRTVTIGAGISGLELEVEDGGGTLKLSGGGVFDLGSLVLDGFDSIEGASSNTKFETLVLDQAGLDAVIAAAGTNTDDIFKSLSDASATGMDTIRLSGNVEFNKVEESALDFRGLDYGSASTVVFDNLGGEDEVNDFQGDPSADVQTLVSVIMGSDGDSDRLVIIPDRDQNYVGRRIVDVENITFDVSSANRGAYTVTLDENTLSGVEVIDGEVNFLADLSNTKQTVNLTGVTISNGQDLSSASAADRISIAQSGIDGFETLGGADGNFISLAVTGNALNLGGATVDKDATLDVLGSSGNDVVVGEAFSVLQPATPRTLFGAPADVTGSATYNLGDGDDSFFGVATTLNLGGGSNTVLTAFVQTLTMNDGKAANLSTDGDNTFRGVVFGATTGGRGDDTLNGLFGAVGAAKTSTGSGNDVITGRAADADLGSGNDQFSTFALSLQLAQQQARGFNLPAAAGGTLNSKVDGGAGNDELSTEIPGDTLTGGAGSDVFTISAKTFSEVKAFSPFDADDNARGTKITAITTGTDGAGGRGIGVVLDDFNQGARDSLQIDILGSYKTGTGLTRLGQAAEGETTVETALNGAVTDDGGLRVVGADGRLRTIAPNQAIGATATLETYDSKDAVATFLNAREQRGVADNTTAVVFGFTGAGAERKLVAFLITDDSANTGIVDVGEISTITIAAIDANARIGGNDIVLI